MGSGKTTAMFNKMNEERDTRYLYVTPYLDEVRRAKEAMNVYFWEPRNFGSGKLEQLHQHLAEKRNVVTTHALFVRLTPETIQLIRDGGYTLVLDEVLDTLSEYNDIVKCLDNKMINKDTVKWLINESLISVDDNSIVTWNSSEVDDFEFSEVVRLAKDGCLRCMDNCLFWEFPVEAFKAFEQIYVMTYMFEFSQMASFFSMNDISYDTISAGLSDDGRYELMPYTDFEKQRNEFASLIDIYVGDLNSIGKNRNSFSVSWLERSDAQRKASIRNVMRNYRDKVGSSSKQIMWTTVKRDNFFEKIEPQGFKYIKRLTQEERNQSEQELNKLRCFVSCTARATNDYKDRDVLLYMLNRYPPTEIERYYLRRGAPLNRDGFALSELLQWIWRSAIRDGKPIKLFVPSSRMRKLLYDWLGIDASSYEPCPKKELKKTNRTDSLKAAS